MICIHTNTLYNNMCFSLSIDKQWSSPLLRLESLHLTWVLFYVMYTGAKGMSEKLQTLTVCGNQTTLFYGQWEPLRDGSDRRLKTVYWQRPEANTGSRLPVP